MRDALVEQVGDQGTEDICFHYHIPIADKPIRGEDVGAIVIYLKSIQEH